MTAGVTRRDDVRLKIGVGTGVSLLHVGVLVLLGIGVTSAPFVPPPPVFDVVMMRLPSPVEADPDRSVGGGAPAAPSRIHSPPEPKPRTVELLAPRQPALEQALLVGLAPIVTEEPGRGQDGVGTGLGSGAGPGDGAGSGTGSGPVLIRGPAEAVITEGVTRASLYDKPGAHVVLRCVLRLTERLENCRIVGEYPLPSGYRQAAVLRSREFRVKPPVLNGRPRDRHPITIALAFPLPPATEEDSSAG